MRRRGTVLALAAAVMVAAPAGALAALSPETNTASPTFAFDTAAPPPPVITTPADGATVPGPDVTVSGTAEAGATVDVFDAMTKVAEAMATDGNWSVTASLSDGAHTLTAVATDAAGDSSPASDAHHVTVDSVAPETTIESGPPPLTNSSSATFTLSSSEAPATFECKLGGPGHAGDFAACDATTAYTGLGDGDYTFSARAKDAAGNVDDTPATQTFTVDTTPPAAPTLSGTPAAFTFSSEPGARFACALDTPSGPGTFAACSSPVSFSGLAPGAYTLRVHAIDAAGNPGPDAAQGFTVAATEPGPSAPLPTPTPTPLAAAPAPAAVFHRAVVARPGLADVRFRLPGATRYVRLTADRALPLGSVLDTRHGTVQLVSLPRPGAKPQRASFDGAVFRVTQPGRTTMLTLVGSCHPARTLSGNGHGAFAVRGRYSTSTVRGSRWAVRDSCSGTLTRAIQGVVQVRDKPHRRTVLVRAGKHYLARPKG